MASGSALCRRRDRDAAEVERLLNEGAEPNAHILHGVTALHQCAIEGNEQIALLLLDHGADVNAKDVEQWTPLHLAAYCAKTEVVKILMSRGANLLAMNENGEMPHDICDDHATLDVIKKEMSAREITEAYIDEQRGAPEKAMLDEMKAMHQQGMALDQRQSDGSTFLHVAAAQGFYDVAAFLLRCEVSPLARDNESWQPLHAAAHWDQVDLLELLCGCGGDINAKTGMGAMPISESTLPRCTAQMEMVIMGTDTSLTARGTIVRQSLRGRSGMTLARLEAQKEGAEILRSWSKEDDPQGDISSAVPPQKHNWLSKRVVKGGSNKAKPMSPDEWLKKLEREEEEDEDSPKRVGSQRRRPKKGGKDDLAENKKKTTCCCIIC